MANADNGKTPTWKRFAKRVTSPHTRDIIKKLAFQTYGALHPRRGQRNLSSMDYGVNLIGHIRGDFGLGESCRLVANALKASGIPLLIHNLPLNGPAGETDTTWLGLERDELRYGVNLIHLNPNEIANAVWRLDRRALRNRYNIAYWLWELQEFPPEWDYTFSLFDEIWTPSVFVSDAIRRRTKKPVLTVPYALTVPKTERKYSRGYFGLPEDVFLFMLSYDGNSVSERKNPMGSVRAYRKAFSPNDCGVGLVIKATHAREGDLADLWHMLSGYPNIFVLTESYGKVEFNSLLQAVDVYVSLHKAEGFGLVMAEAMLLGTAVIATNWSANTEFMDTSVACMVRGDIVALAQDYPPYYKGNHWAAPDEAEAAVYMRKLYENSVFRDTMVKKARHHIMDLLSAENAAQKIRQRVETLFDLRTAER